MALPGRVDSPASAGCHKIIREGWATLVTGPGDILDCLGEAGQTLKAVLTPEVAAESSSTTDLGSNLSAESRKIYDTISTEPVFVDTLCDATGLDIGAIQSTLMQLQLTGLIERLPSNRVRRRK
jgi:DNA processing protein